MPKPLPVADPDIIRRLDIGQAAYIYQGGVTYLHIKPPAYAPVAEPAPAGVPALPSTEPPTWPNVSWRGPAPALPPADTQPPPIAAATEPLPAIPAAPEQPPRPVTSTQASGEPDPLAIFTHSFDQPRRQPHE
ncbi:MAG TPA: hypothetical protein VMG38_21705 [Trebonia sp.]|nr:hypothetical protein [Trebonia sp.]